MILGMELKGVEVVSEDVWEGLLSRTLSSLDDQALERLERCREVAAKKLRRMGLTDVPFDRGMVKRFLLEYAKLGHRYGMCVKRSGVDAEMLLTAWDLWPEAKFVCEYVRHLRKTAREMENEDRLDDALESLGRLNTDEECRLNAKSVMFTVGALDREHFGDDRGGEERRGRSQVTYVIPNLTVNNIFSPEEIAERRARVLEADPAIEVESVVAEPVREAVKA